MVKFISNVHSIQNRKHIKNVNLIVLYCNISLNINGLTCFIGVTYLVRLLNIDKLKRLPVYTIAPNFSFEITALGARLNMNYVIWKF
jgi:hypothetical protein